VCVHVCVYPCLHTWEFMRNGGADRTLLWEVTSNNMVSTRQTQNQDQFFACSHVSETADLNQTLVRNDDLNSVPWRPFVGFPGTW
jgi:hypothetical protein